MVQLSYVYTTTQVNTRNYLAMSQIRSHSSDTNFDVTEEEGFGLVWYKSKSYMYMNGLFYKKRYNHKRIWLELPIVQENVSCLTHGLH